MMKDLAISVESTAIIDNVTYIVKWTDQHGTERNLNELTDSHLDNLLVWLDHRYIMTMNIVYAEMKRRIIGVYPVNFHKMLDDYMAKPEIYNMTVIKQ